MTKKMNGGKVYQTKYDEYIQKILEENDNIYKYEARLIIRAFKKTVDYFLNNAIEFYINDVFKFIKVFKKESCTYATYKHEIVNIPEHTMMKFKLFPSLKHYLNSRYKFKNARHREKLPDGLVRNKNIF